MASFLFQWQNPFQVLDQTLVLPASPAHASSWAIPIAHASTPGSSSGQQYCSTPMIPVFRGRLKHLALGMSSALQASETIKSLQSPGFRIQKSLRIAGWFQVSSIWTHPGVVQSREFVVKPLKRTRPWSAHLMKPDHKSKATQMDSRIFTAVPQSSDDSNQRRVHSGLIFYGTFIF